MTIHILDPLLANQIAAGEVIERPASVVKELIENSLDAKPQFIKIDIQQGGQELIRITDDGEGIAATDLPLAPERHATSKISSLNDLEQVRSLGFRGEALASISAVSRLQITSRHFAADCAYTLPSPHELANMGESLKPAAHPPGTTVEVKDLFYNTPARRKFLRQAKTEFSHIETIVQRLALSRFDVGFRLHHNQRLIFNLQPAMDMTQQEQRIAQILGQSFMENALALEFSANGIRLHGWIALPNFNRSQADMQYFYVNGRFVRDKLLSHALRQAYEDVLFHGRQSAYILYIECDPTQVDVNVHPTKHEVRFRENQIVHNLLVQGVRQALAHVCPGQDHRQLNHCQHPPSSHQLASAGEGQDGGLKKPSQQKHFSFQIQEQMRVYNDLHPLPAEKLTTMEKTHEPIHPAENVACFPENNEEFPLGFALGQLQDIYILAQNQRGLLIIDMHAAHERILYEKLKSQLNTVGIARQSLLVPIVVHLNRQEMQCWEQYQVQFLELGLQIEQMGPETIAVREVSTLLKHLHIEQLVRDVLADLITHENSARIQEQINVLLATICCRAAIRANQKLSLPEMNAILRQMEQTQHSGQCNHGRPTWIQFSYKELDQFFLRGR